MGTTYVETVELTTMSCSCGGIFAICEAYRAQRQKYGGHWWCPYCGNQRVYRKTDIQRLQEQLEAEQRRAIQERQQHDQTKADLRETESRRRAEKAAKTRIKNRMAKGVCPCCNRYFADLHAHMHIEHPDFTDEPA
jgi:hypothetical protein